MKLEGGEERWGPAGEENGVELYFVWRAAANKLDLSAECIRIGRNGSLLTRVGIEVTVGTAMTAKRDGNVHRVVKFHVSSVMCELPGGGPPEPPLEWMEGFVFGGKPITRAMGPASKTQMAKPRPQACA